MHQTKILVSSIAVYLTVAACGAIVEGGASANLGGLADAAIENLLAPVGSTAANESGSRIKATWIVSDEGAKHFSGWHDSELDHECVWQTGTDDSKRCLPIGAEKLSSFSDAECATPIFFSPCGGFLYGLRITGCSHDRYEVHLLETEPLPEGTDLYVDFGDSCKLQTDVPDVDYYYLSAGVVPPSEFARGSVVIED